MNFKDVLAVIVSYNGLATIRQTVDALRGQVGYIHVVDNGSAPSLSVYSTRWNGSWVSRSSAWGRIAAWGTL